MSCAITDTGTEFAATLRSLKGSPEPSPRWRPRPVVESGLLPPMTTPFAGGVRVAHRRRARPLPQPAPTA